MALTCDDLVAAVRRLAFLPDASDLSATDILAMADDELTTLVFEFIKDAREEYGIAVEDAALSASVLYYRLPRRATERTVRAVTLLDPTGREHPAIEESAAAAYGLSTDQWNRRYHFQGDSIGFRQFPTAGWSLRVRYMMRPSKLIAVASGAAVYRGNSTTALDLTGASATAGLAASMAADIVRGDSPYDLMYIDRHVTAYTASSSVTFDATTPIVVADFVSRSYQSNARVDYVCARDQTVYPPVTPAQFPVLVAATARRALEEIGDRAGAEVAEATMQARLKAAKAVAQPRNEQGSRAIIGSSFRGGRAFAGRRWR